MRRPKPQADSPIRPSRDKNYGKRIRCLFPFYDLVFLARREWTSILTTTLTFLGTVVLGFILLPSQSVQFWTSAIQDTSRVGRVRELGNISFQGIISTVVPEGVLLKALYILAAVAFIVLIYVFIRLSDKMYDAYVSNYITACAALLVSAFISPISWSHHSVYIPLIIICFIVFEFSLVQKTIEDRKSVV